MGVRGEREYYTELTRDDFNDYLRALGFVGTLRRGSRYFLDAERPENRVEYGGVVDARGQLDHYRTLQKLRAVRRRLAAGTDLLHAERRVYTPPADRRVLPDFEQITLALGDYGTRPNRRRGESPRPTE